MGIPNPRVALDAAHQCWGSLSTGSPAGQPMQKSHLLVSNNASAWVGSMYSQVHVNPLKKSPGVSMALGQRQVMKSGKPRIPREAWWQGSGCPHRQRVIKGLDQPAYLPSG